MSKQREDFKKPSVLIVDDENRVRQVCSQMLCQEGYEVAQAEHAEMGLEKIAQRHFDIILLDLLMPGMSGLEALSRSGPCTRTRLWLSSPATPLWIMPWKP
jgi:two-component system, OmpR family, phosphate regulon sensor histidine kinase PhoR